MIISDLDLDNWLMRRFNESCLRSDDYHIDNYLWSPIRLKYENLMKERNKK